MRDHTKLQPIELADELVCLSRRFTAKLPTDPVPQRLSAQLLYQSHPTSLKASAMARQKAITRFLHRMGAKLHHNQIVKDHGCAKHPKSTESESEPTSPRYDGGIFPLDDQCLLLFSGTGENRTHIVRFKRPMHYLVCHNPKLCFRCFVSVGVAGIEPATVAL